MVIMGLTNTFITFGGPTLHDSSEGEQWRRYNLPSYIGSLYPWLVISTPVKKYDFVNWDDDIYSQLNGQIIQSCSIQHQPDVDSISQYFTTIIPLLTHS